ncbi:alanine/glycine:cation symporter family protein [Posidoniimonas polymericola]|nr:alanine/glycine:cation symporter family protein [Posidoniimonas polymericola]
MPFAPSHPALSKIFLSVMLALATLGSPTPLLAQEQGENATESNPAVASDEAPAEAADGDWMADVDGWFGEYLVGPLVAVLFYDFNSKEWLGTSVPVVVVWLFCGAAFLTLRMMFINVRAFWHAIRVTKGDFDGDHDDGEVSHFQALSSALSATVGLGNIAGVAIAVGSGGPGAVFWMVLAGLLGMSSKFTECTLGQMYRHVDNEGRVLGGPMRYLKEGLAEMNMGPLGAVLAFLFSVLCIGGSFGGGCAFQVSQSLDIVKSQAPWLQGREWIYGAVLVACVGVVILGGIRRIASTAEKIVPLMCVVYVIGALIILGTNADEIGGAFATIFQEAFKWESAYGGLLGVMVMGIKRSAFSNEAGIGSAAIAHSAARTKYPVREGIVALLEPFIDTVVICTMTGLVIVITGVYDTERFPEHAELIAGDQGARLTSIAFQSVVPWFSIVLAVAAMLFAYSTMISWSYYGERCFTHLFGVKASLPYRILFLCFVFLGAVVTAQNANVFSELMILSMAFPNMLGLLLLSGKVKRSLDEYWGAYKRGEIRANG